MASTVVEFGKSSEGLVNVSADTVIILGSVSTTAASAIMMVHSISDSKWNLRK